MSDARAREIADRAEAVAYDLDLAEVKRYREATGRGAIGFLPVYVPREIIHAAGHLPVAIFGGGDRLEIIRGDAYFQSYICHLPRSVVELLVTGRLAPLDGFVFPSTCDVVRNLSGIWQMLAPEKYVRYLDLPQSDVPEIAGRFYGAELRTLGEDLARLRGQKLEAEELREAIRLYNRNRDRLQALGELRRRSPWLVPASEAYVVVRAGAVLPVEAHTALLDEYLEAARASGRREMDHSRVVVEGAFCEQPPLGLVKTLERAGCYVVEDDFLLGLKWLGRNVAETGDPWDALVAAYLEASAANATKYIGPDRKGRALVEAVRRAGAEGVVFCAPSFCDPALLDQPMIAAALEREGIPATSFKYSEDTGQFAVIREQTGTFADSIRLWSEA